MTTTTTRRYDAELRAGMSHEAAEGELRRIEADLELARHKVTTLRAEESPDADRAYVDAVTLLRQQRRALLDYYGVTCPSCRGDGDVISGELRATMTSPREYTYAVCRLCSGDGEVLYEEADAWIGKLDDDYDDVIEWLEETSHPWTTIRDLED